MDTLFFGLIRSSHVRVAGCYFNHNRSRNSFLDIDSYVCSYRTKLGVYSSSHWANLGVYSSRSIVTEPTLHFPFYLHVDVAILEIQV